MNDATSKRAEKSERSSNTASSASGGTSCATVSTSWSIGSTLAQLRWSPGEALLTNGSQTRRYESVDALVDDRLKRIGAL